MDVKELVEQINQLSVLQLVELKDALKEMWGVEAAAPVAMMAPVAGAGAGEAPAEEEKEYFAVKLTGVTGNKIQVIKAVRELTSLGLKEAKDLVEAAPDAVVAEEVTKSEADNYKTKLEEAGGTVEIV